jgi:hypothetical protein
MLARFKVDLRIPFFAVDTLQLEAVLLAGLREVYPLLLTPLLEERRLPCGTISRSWLAMSSACEWVWAVSSKAAVKATTKMEPERKRLT